MPYLYKKKVFVGFFLSRPSGSSILNSTFWWPSSITIYISLYVIWFMAIVLLELAALIGFETWIFLKLIIYACNWFNLSCFWSNYFEIELNVYVMRTLILNWHTSAISFSSISISLPCPAPTALLPCKVHCLTMSINLWDSITPWNCPLSLLNITHIWLPSWFYYSFS